MSNGWKVVAIIFIILFILETLFLVLAFSYAVDSLKKENECVYNICKDYDGYDFNIDDICSCYENGVLVYEEYVR